MKRIARKPEVLKKKIEIFRMLLDHKKVFAVNVLWRSPQHHFIKINFVVDGVRYYGLQQRYVRRFPMIDYITLQRDDGNHKALTVIQINQLYQRVESNV